MKTFTELEIGDIVIVNDEYGYSGHHHILIESVETDKENITETNPKGIKYYGKDLDWFNSETGDYENDDDYITNVDEANFVEFHDTISEYAKEFAEEHDVLYGRCETCKNYSNATICSGCIEGSEYKFDWKYYYEEHKEEIDEEYIGYNY